MCKSIIVNLLILIILTNSNLFAHSEWVHQHMTKAAYNLLKNQIGFDVSEMMDHIGLDIY